MKPAIREKAIVCWSGGKDCALALHEVRDQFEIIALVTTVTSGYERVSMHGVRTDLLERQAKALGYSLETVVVSPACTNDEYERAMRAALDRYRAEGVSVAICGDLFLEEVRQYRKERLFGDGLRGVFPLWRQPTAALARKFIELGFEAVLCCVDTTAIDASFAGRRFDAALLVDLPASADPCGENGEFHTFVYGGPGFAQPVKFELGERVLRDGRFGYCDLVLREERI